MSTFYLYLKQSGGCDYTIACGEKLISAMIGTMDDEKTPKVATTIEEARTAAEEAYCCSDSIKEISILEVYNKEEVDMDKMIANIERKRRKKELEEEKVEELRKEKEERILFNKLKKKYEEKR
jgi:hypothetical protein